MSLILGVAIGIFCGWLMREKMYDWTQQKEKDEKKKYQELKKKFEK